MPTISFETPLGDDETDWIRFRLVTIGGIVTTFVVQYETTITGERLPVVRYDNAHGFCHRDILNRRGDVVEKRMIVGTPATVATLGKTDIVNNWRRYQAAFLAS